MNTALDTRARAKPPELTALRDDVAEEAVLGAIILDDQVLPLVLAQLSEEDFGAPEHAEVFSAMRAVVGRGAKVDFISLDRELRARNRLNTVGGAQALAELVDRLAAIGWSTAHVETHARLVADTARRRRIYVLCATLAGQVKDPATPMEVLARGVRAMVDAVAARHDARLVTLGEAFVEVLDRYLAGDAGGAVLVPTGFVDFDRRLAGGFRPKQLIVIAARPAMGKTSIALALALHAAALQNERAQETGRPPARVLFISMETSAGDLSLRAAAVRGHFDAHGVRSGTLPADQMMAFMAMGSVLDPLPVRILDTGALKLSALRALVLRECLRDGGLAMVIVDYLQLTKPDERSDSREREVSEVARGLKDLAMEANLPVVALSQLSRACEQRPGKHKRPMMSDLRESGEIEAAADVVTFLYRDEVYNKDTEDKGVAEWIVAKQRNGPLGTVRLAWIAEQTRFESLTEDAPGEDSYSVGGYRPGARGAAASQDEEVAW